MRTTTARANAYTSPLLASVERAIEKLTAQQQRDDTGSETFRDAPSAPTGHETTARLEALGETVARLQQIKEWLESDQHLLTVVDDYIGAHVRAQTYKLRRLNIALAVSMTMIGAILGWLLSSLVPSSLLTSIFAH